MKGAPTATRTRDLPLRRRSRYSASYQGIQGSHLTPLSRPGAAAARLSMSVRPLFRAWRRRGTHDGGTPALRREPFNELAFASAGAVAADARHRAPVDADRRQDPARPRAPVEPLVGLEPLRER